MDTSDVVALLLELIVESGVRPAGGSHCMQAIKKRDPALRKIVDDAGGLKKFCSQHNVLEFVTVAGSDGFIRRRVSAPDILDALLALVDEHGGKLAGSQAVPALEKCASAFRDVIECAGGLKKFCLLHRDVEFITDSCGGFVQRAGMPQAKAAGQAGSKPRGSSSVLRSRGTFLAPTPSTSSTSSGASSSSSASVSECSSDREEPTAAHVNSRQVAGATHCNLGNVRTMYHATTQSNARSIIRTCEFYPGMGGYLGPGIYFCEDPSTAMRRAKPNSKGKLVVLEFKVQMGRMHELEEKTPWTEDILLKAGFHSMKAHGPTNDCYMIPSNSLGQIDMSTLHEI